jgi:glycosyltransferase involved in cell wall biosynthesis
MRKKLKDTENKLSEVEKKNGELERQLQYRDLVISMGGHKEQVKTVGKKFKNGTIDLSVIVPYNLEDSTKNVRRLSLLYLIDYFNVLAAKSKLVIEMVFVHPSKVSTIPETIITTNTVSEFKSAVSDSVEELLNEGARGAFGKYLLFIPVLASKSPALDIDLLLDVPKMLSHFKKDSKVGIVGGSVENIINNTLINAGIDFAYAIQDAVIPFARFIGAGVHYPKKSESAPCVSKTGMMVERELFNSLRGFSGAYTKDNYLSPLAQLMEDSSLCLQVLARSRKVIYIPESIIKTSFPENKITAPNIQPGGLLTTFNNTWYSAARILIESKKEITDFMLVWDLYCGCTGVNVEAISYLVALESKLDVGAVAGADCWCGGFPTYVQESLLRISSRKIGPEVDVWVSHKPPEKYPSFPYKGLVTVLNRPTHIIGRSMSETDTIKAKWVESSTKADEIWVPTEFHREVFASSGISNSKLTVIEESLDTTLYHPEHTEPLSLDPQYNSAYKFLSVFKWEARKGWDVLLQGYFEEFSASENVLLVLQTYLYGERNPRDRKRVEERILNFANTLALNNKRLPPVLVLTDELPEIMMPRLYKACDAFVLPTRGEGWGLPVMEAMSMELPSIVTNWSGPTQFTTKDTAYLLPFDELETVPATFEGGSGVEKWAKPSLPQLKQMMREIYSRPQTAKQVGKRARQHIVDNFDREIIAEKMVDRLKQIKQTFE